VAALAFAGYVSSGGGRRRRFGEAVVTFDPAGDGADAGDPARGLPAHDGVRDPHRLRDRRSGGDRSGGHRLGPASSTAWTSRRVNDRINEVMRRLSAWAAIFAASTAITGFYGMNVLFPQFDTPAGAVTASGLLAVTTLALVAFFRTRRWL
jgi:hypothetical protein